MILNQSSPFHFKNFKEINSEDLKTIFEWRNHPKIRKWMTNKQLIKWNEHLNYIESLKTNTTKEAYLCDYNNSPIGVINVLKNTKNNEAEIGFYISPSKLDNGYGLRLGFYGAQFLFQDKGFDKLMFKAQKNNKSVLRLWNIIGIERERIYESKSSHTELKGELSRTSFETWPKSYKSFLEMRIQKIKSTHAEL